MAEGNNSTAFGSRTYFFFWVLDPSWTHVPDVDDTAKTIAALRLLESPVSFDGLIKRFELESHFQCYPLERNPSFTANCNVLLAFLLAPEPSQYRAQIIKCIRFISDQWWNSDSLVSDKWVLSKHQIDTDDRTYLFITLSWLDRRVWSAFCIYMKPPTSRYLKTSYWRLSSSFSKSFHTLFNTRTRTGVGVLLEVARKRHTQSLHLPTSLRYHLSLLSSAKLNPRFLEGGITSSKGKL